MKRPCLTLLLQLFAAVAVCSQMVLVPGGSFIMGGTGGDDDEVPPRRVDISPFLMDAREVTAAMYDSCVQKKACTPAHYDDGKCYMWTSAGIQSVRVPEQYRSADYPVVCVSWSQAREYCRFKGKKLPTEAQWEYAASAGSDNLYAWGNAPPSPATCVQKSRNGPAKAGSFQPNAWGLYDMSGNVWEWTEDRYIRDFYAVSDSVNPSGPPVGRFRVIRGGGWYSTARQLRTKNRQWFAPEAGEASIGIRCVK